MTPDAAMVDFARANALLANDEDGAWTALAGGVSSDIWCLRSHCGQVCIKRALPELKVAVTWQVPVERNAFEWSYLQVVNRIAPGAVPQPIAHDPDQGLFAMAWLPPDRHLVWKSELLSGRIDAAFAAQVGELLGRIHATTAQDPSIPPRFPTDANFYAIRIEPYLLTIADRHADLAPAIRSAANILATTKYALVHGDVSPKNILMAPGGPILLDAECAWFGDPAFDAAFCLNHLAIKARIVSERRGELLRAFDRFAAAYLAQVGWENPADLEKRAARLLPMLALARVDGKSPVEYLGVADRNALRRAARAAIAAAPDTLASVRDMLAL